MRDSPTARLQVLEAANQLIANGGLAGFSMLALAQNMGMSKETLYAWFGSKDQLLQALISGNTAAMRGVLQRGGEINSVDGLRRSLESFCVALLKLLMSDRSVALNRAAVHQVGGAQTGEVLRSVGRDAVIAELSAALTKASKAGLLSKLTPDSAEVLIALALRDWQIERLVGRMADPSARRVHGRARQAVELFFKLYSQA